MNDKPSAAGVAQKTETFCIEFTANEIAHLLDILEDVSEIRFHLPVSKDNGQELSKIYDKLKAVCKR
jgi:hypothetical protein